MKKLEMDFVERIALNPFEKYVRFGIFPWKFIFHLLLVGLCTYQALKTISTQDKNTRIQEIVFSKIYLEDDDGDNFNSYYSLSEFSQVFFNTVNQTQSLQDSILQYSNIENVQYELQIYYSELSPHKNPKLVYSGNSETFLIELQQIPLHDGNYTEMKNFIQSVETLHFNIKNIITYLSTDSRGKPNKCLNWSIQINYNFQSFASVLGTLSTEPQVCLAGSNAFHDEPIMGINLSILVISILSLIAAWKQVYKISKQYMIYKKIILSESKHELKEEKLKGGNLDWRKNWDQLGFFDKLQFFDFWFIISVTGNFFQFFGSLVAFLDNIIKTKLIIFEQKQLLIGFSVMLAWITILKYLQYNDKMNILMATMSNSWGNLFLFLLGVMPFFMGFVFLGQTIFWKYQKFSDSSTSTITLFAILNGDIVNDTFLETWAQGLAGQLYLIIFIVFFYTAVQNLLVTIIMEGYEQSLKEREYKKYLQEKQGKEIELLEKSFNFEIKTGIIEENPDLQAEDQDDYEKMKAKGIKVDLLLEEVKNIERNIQGSELNESQKEYLKGIILDDMNSMIRTIKLQINEIQ